MNQNKEPSNNKRNEIIAELQNQIKIEKEKVKKAEKYLEQYKAYENKILEQIKKGVQNGEIIDNYRKILNENLKLTNKLKILGTNENSEITKLNLKLNEDLFKERNKIIELEKEKEEIVKGKIEEFENYKKNDYNIEYIEKKFEDFYDVVINIKSISSLSTPEGWPIKWNINRKEILKNIKEKKLFKIGVLGNGNMGKSFLLSRLFGEKIPSGYSIITEGLSIKHNYEKGYTILDSAGLQTPLLKEYEKEEEEKKEEAKNDLGENSKEKDFKENENLYKDKTQTENFIQNLILYLSDMFLIVVGKITFNEQRLINKIKKEIELGNRDENKKKQIFIIHNLINFQTKKQVDDHIKNTLLKSASFKLTETKDINKSQEKKEDIFYFVKMRVNFKLFI